MTRQEGDMTRTTTLKLSRISAGCGRGITRDAAVLALCRIGRHHGWNVGYLLAGDCGCVSLCRTEAIAWAERARSLAAQSPPLTVATPIVRTIH